MTLLDILLIMAAAVVFVPLARRARLSSILGYLIAGAAIGPWGLGVVTEVEDIRHLAEFGVVLLLFIIGIELKPQRLWTMRRQVFGLGGLQVVLSGTVLALAAWALGLPGPAAIVGGFGLALSSTAMGLQLLSERNEMGSVHGRATFAILLLQDLMVPVLLTLTPLLAETGRGVPADIGFAVIEAAAVLAGAGLAGRFLIGPLFRAVAATRSAEVFTATALLVVLGMAWAMEHVGLSMALGAFVAGLLLANSEFRHQVEADIQPFRGLLLGLFFMGVGMSVDFGLMTEHGAAVIGVVVGLMVVKALLLLPLVRLFGLAFGDAIRAAFLLAQGGEFAFVLFSFATTVDAMDEGTAQFLILAVALSMALTPFVATAGARLAARVSRHPPPPETPPRPESRDGHVIICGFGRVGETVARMLEQAGRPYIAFDLDMERVQEARKAGMNVYYGDASRAQVLEAAHADHAALVVVTTDTSAATARIVAQIRHYYPDLPIYARARDPRHSRMLRHQGATATVPETLEASLQLGGIVLASTGMAAEEVAALLEGWRRDEYAPLLEAVSSAAPQDVPTDEQPRKTTSPVGSP